MSKAEYKLMVDKPKELVGTIINANDSLRGRVVKIIRKDPPFTIYQFEFNKEKDKI